MKRVPDRAERLTKQIPPDGKMMPWRTVRIIQGDGQTPQEQQNCQHHRTGAHSPHLEIPLPLYPGNLPPPLLQQNKLTLQSQNTPAPRSPRDNTVSQDSSTATLLREMEPLI